MHLFLLNLLFFSMGIASEPALEFRAIIKGNVDKRFRRLLEDNSKTFELSKEGVATIGILRKIAETDTITLEKILATEGYYSSLVSLRINENEKPVIVEFFINPGSLYIIKSMSIFDESGAFLELPPIQEIITSKRHPARAEYIIFTEKRILQWYSENGYPLAEITNRRLFVDHESASINIEWSIKTGGQAHFDDVAIKGLSSVDEKIVLSKIPWKKGDIFDARKLIELQKRLTTTGLFNMVRIFTKDSIQAGGSLPVIIEVEERKPRTIGMGAGYRTDEGIGAGLSWEHRNLRRKAERLSISVKTSRIKRNADIEYVKPGFIHPKQYLILGARISEEEIDAYSSETFITTGIIKREISSGISIGGGFGYKHSEVEQKNISKTYDFFFFPFTFDYDFSDDLFLPSKGGRLNTWVAPFIDMSGGDSSFIKLRVSGSRYIKISSSPSTILAGRISVGTISNAVLEDIPPDELFYAGGGGSIRGYAYKSVSPLDEDIPTGGLSIFEASLEARISLTERTGIIPFIDAGNAYSDNFPDFGDLLYGAGIGLSYNTPIGPIRFDIAFPLDKRDKIDDSVQFYISIGSPF